MSVEIDFPQPGSIVGSTFPVGGVFDASALNVDAAITVVLNDSGGTLVATSAPFPVKAGTTGSWSVSITDPGLNHLGCYLVATLSNGGGSDQTDDITTLSTATGWIQITLGP
jgi:hypothetical protein